MGIIISLIYLRTKNLFIAMGIHALWNLPNLFVSDNIGGFIAVIFSSGTFGGLAAIFES